MALRIVANNITRSFKLPGGKCRAQGQSCNRYSQINHASSSFRPYTLVNIASSQYKPLAPSPIQTVNPRMQYQNYWNLLEETKQISPVKKHGVVNWNRMKCYVQFITTPTADTPGTTLLLHFDNKRYLIGNVAEGTQRAAVQRKLGLLKVKDIFLTGPVRWSGFGGILGMLLTVADSLTTSRASQEENAKKGKKGEQKDKEVVDEGLIPKDTLTLHGGRNLMQLIATARRFVFRKGVPTRVNEFKKDREIGAEEPTWSDENILVWSMVVEPETAKAVQSNGRSRKRSHEEFVNENAMDTSVDLAETTEEREVRYDGMRRAVVESMFDSTWKLDALFKKRLSEVKKGEGVVFVRNEQGKIEEYKGPFMHDDPLILDREVLMRNPWPGAKIETLPPTTPSYSSICYIFKNHPQRGKFDPKKAMALNVPKGKMWAQLTKGESVVSNDGITVSPDMVLGAGRDGNGFAVVELPDTSYVAPLVARQEWKSEKIMAGVQSIIWILGKGVIEDASLQTFMQHHSKVKHVVSGRDHGTNYLALESAATSAIRLNLLDPGRFPIPKHSNEKPVSAVSSKIYDVSHPGLSLMLQPDFKVDTTQILPVLDTAKVVAEASPEVQKLADIAREQINEPAYLEQLERKQQDIPSKDAEVITLGTGSALPSKYRNVSATLVRVPGYGSYLLDCGENTIGQLSRVFGDELPEILLDLKAIWISHLHADHHLGTASVIKAWAEATAKHTSMQDAKLIVASDEAMLHWLREYAEIEDFGHSRVEPISLGRATTFHHRFSHQETAQHGLESIQSCMVQHCNGAMAVVLTLPNGFKVAYSGDCRPSDFFAKIGKGATLLIHEATFDDELIGDAKAKKHSTTGEALHVGKMMGARRILLTHFSQRYQKLPVMDTEGDKDQVAIVAFDYMRVKLGDFVVQEAFKPALLELFKDDE